MKQFAQPRQQGVILIAALVILVVMTMIGMSTITTTNVNMMLANFQRSQVEVESVAQNVLSYMISDVDYYVNYENYLDANDNFVAAIPADLQQGKESTIEFVRCIRETPGIGGAMNIGVQVAVTPRYYWEVGVSVSEPVTSTQGTYVQGFRMTYLEGYCP